MIENLSYSLYKITLIYFDFSVFAQYILTIKYLGFHMSELRFEKQKNSKPMYIDSPQGNFSYDKPSYGCPAFLCPSFVRES